MTCMYWVPSDVSGKSPPISIVSNSSGPDDGKLHFSPRAVLGAVSRAAWVCVYDMVEVGGHLGLVKVAMQCVLYKSVTSIFSNGRTMCHHGYALAKQRGHYDLYGGVDNWPSYKQHNCVDTKLAIIAAYLARCCLHVNVVFLRADKFDKDWWIECGFFCACFSSCDVQVMRIVTVVGYVWGMWMHDTVDGLKLEIVFKWAFSSSYLWRAVIAHWRLCAYLQING